jgi:hypothetical protein
MYVFNAKIFKRRKKCKKKNQILALNWRCRENFILVLGILVLNFTLFAIVSANLSVNTEGRRPHSRENEAFFRAPRIILSTSHSPTRKARPRCRPTTPHSQDGQLA